MKKIWIGAAVWVTYGGSDRLGCARLLEAELEAILPRIICCDWNSGGWRSSTFLNRCLWRKLKQLFVKAFGQKLKIKRVKVIMNILGAAHFCSCVQWVLRTISMDLQLGSNSFLRDIVYISAGLEDACHMLGCISWLSETPMVPPWVIKNQTSSLSAICWSGLPLLFINVLPICISWYCSHNAQALQHTGVVKAVATEEENTMQVNVVRKVGLHCALEIDWTWHFAWSQFQAPIDNIVCVVKEKLSKFKVLVSAEITLHCHR